MVFMIIAASKNFNSTLALAGASDGLTGLVKGLDVQIRWASVPYVIFDMLIVAMIILWPPIACGCPAS